MWTMTGSLRKVTVSPLTGRYYCTERQTVIEEVILMLVNLFFTGALLVFPLMQNDPLCPFVFHYLL